MKKIILVVLGCFVITLVGVASLNAKTIIFSINGYNKTCSDLGDEEYCNYCKCQTGKGYQGIPSWQCDDGSKPVCTNNLDEITKDNQLQKRNTEPQISPEPSDTHKGQAPK